jgi:uncharacterized protein with HEPN domain
LAKHNYIVVISQDGYFDLLTEATQRLDDSKKVMRPDIPWKEISGFRNILVHNYLGDIDALTIAKVIEEYLPPLEDCIRTLLEPDTS